MTNSVTNQFAPTHSIAVDAHGFAVLELRAGNDRMESMAWSEVQEVTVYKRDLFARDCICLWVRRADRTGVEVDGEMPGYRPFLEALPQHLPGCMAWEDWFRQVAFPAFATNQTWISIRKPTP